MSAQLKTKVLEEVRPPNTADKIREKVREYNAYEQDSLDMHNLVVSVLTAFDGKTANKRLATALQKELPNMIVHYENEKLWNPVIRIWDNKISYSERKEYRFDFGCGANEPFDLQAFKDTNRGSGWCAQERIDQNNEFLTNDQQIEFMAHTIDMYNIAKKELNKYSHTNIPAYFSINKLWKD